MRLTCPPESKRAGYCSLTQDTKTENVSEAAREVAKEFGQMFGAMEARMSNMAPQVPAFWSPHEPRELSNFIRLIEAVQAAATDRTDQSGQVAALIWLKLRSRDLVADLRATCARLRSIDRRNLQNEIQAGDGAIFEAASVALKEFANSRCNE